MDTIPFNLSMCRDIYNFCEDKDLCFRDVLEAIIVEKRQDFQMGDYRFIHESHLDHSLYLDYKDDYYGLGSFSSWFIAENTDLSQGIVEKIQEAGGWEELGEYISRSKNFIEFIQEAACIDGYAHFFATYDGLEDNSIISSGYMVYRQ